MALHQFYINLKSTSPTRFAMDKFFEFDGDNFDPLTSYFAEQLLALPAQGKFTIVSEAGRPDQLAVGIYGDSQFWWIILMYNRRSTFDAIAPGDVFEYPSITDLENLYFSLVAKQTAQQAGKSTV